MNQRSLLFFGIAGAFLSALLLVYVTLQIEKSQKDVAWTYSGSGLSLLQYHSQNSLNTLRFAESVYDYRNHLDSNDEQKLVELRGAYLQEFDIVWSAFVFLKQFSGVTEYPDLVTFREGSKEILESLDPLMQPDIALTDEQLNQVIDGINSLAHLNSNLGNAHLARMANRSVELNEAISRLQTLAYLLMLTFLIALCITGYLIWRMLKQERAQGEQLRVAHQQQQVLVSELRSGEADKRAKSQFLAAVSHDLRQPLHALGLFLNSLEKNITGKDGHNILAKIRSSTSALNGLFSAMLDISRLDAGAVEVEKTQVSLNKLFNFLHEDCREVADEQSILLTIRPTDLHVYSDQVLLTRVLRNLLENALVHAPNSRVTLEARLLGPKSGEHSIVDGDITGKISQTAASSEESTNNIEIRLSDTGPGIPEKMREVVFSEYYQLNNPERDRNKGLSLIHI